MGKTKRILIYVLALFIIPAASAASENPPAGSVQESPKETDEAPSATMQELLFFYEEKDLVVATRRATTLRKAPAIASIVTADEIKNMGARNLMDVLKMIPGIGISINEFGRYMFEVRGIRTATSEKILVMIDGHRLNESYTGSALANIYNDLAVENIKQVEVIRGPGSALYGANAFAAVINVVTKNADDTDGIEISAAGGTFDTKKTNFLGGKSFGDFQVSGALNYLNTNGPDPLIEKDRFAGRSYTTTPGRADMHLEKSDAFLKVSYGDITFKGQYVSKNRGAYIGNASALTDENFIHFKNFWGELSYAKSLTDALSSSVRLYFDQFEQDAKVELFPEGYPGYPDGVVGQPLLKNRTLGAEIQFEYELFSGNNLTVGGLYENIKQFDVKHFTNFHPVTIAPLGSFQEITSWGNFNKDAKREVLAVFIQDEWGLRDNLNITAGLRYDHYSDFGDTFNPRAGIVWEFMRNAELKLLFGQAFRAPNFVELYNANNPTVIGNPRLKPEKIKTYEAGVGYRFSKSFRTNLNYFFSKIEDLIVRDASTSPAQYANKGGAEVHGVEFELTGNYTVANYWKLSYIYQEPKDSDTKQRLHSVPSQRAAASVNCGLSKYINSHVDILWMGPRPRASGDTRTKMPSYTTVDLALIAKEFYRNLEIKGTVHNLFDNRYKDPDSSGLVSSDFPRPGIEATIGVTYKF